ncbi:MAG: hypothetical protein PHW14_05050 [Candidatus Omnitrophica bacterium]|nr:hypothetical protein [Candidatus Omnitrophota bacterium]
MGEQGDDSTLGGAIYVIFTEILLAVFVFYCIVPRHIITEPCVEYTSISSNTTYCDVEKELKRNYKLVSFREIEGISIHCFNSNSGDTSASCVVFTCDSNTVPKTIENRCMGFIEGAKIKKFKGGFILFFNESLPITGQYATDGGGIGIIGLINP